MKSKSRIWLETNFTVEEDDITKKEFYRDKCRDDALEGVKKEAIR